MLKVSTLICSVGLLVVGGCAVSPTPMSEVKEAKIAAGERAPCISMPLPKFKQCGCHPRVSAAIDVMDSSGLPETARAELERCLSGETQAKANVGGRQVGELEGALKSCLSQKISVNETVAAAVGDIAKNVSAQPISKAETCNWSRCVYGPDAQCDG